MPRRKIEQVALNIDDSKKTNIIEEYKELDTECDKVLEKIVKRQSKRAKKSAA